VPESRPPLPAFTRKTAIQKVRGAENAWNTCNPQQVCLGYSIDCKWRNRAEIFAGRDAIVAFLTRKWQRELDYRLIKELWAFTGNLIAVRFAYEYRDDSGNWFRAYGNENWEYDGYGLNIHRHASINDRPIKENERLFHWDRSGPRPADHPGLSDLGL
jgi:nuclear transport factor 2 (NTF2) superfamily protein